MHKKVAEIRLLAPLEWEGRGSLTGSPFSGLIRDLRFEDLQYIEFQYGM
jgi:hypothetical protein